jgi:regulatory protein
VKASGRVSPDDDAPRTQKPKPRSREPRNTSSRRSLCNADPGRAPTRAALHEAALSYLAHGAASADSVVKTLQRRIGNWARRATRAGRDVETVALDAAAARELIREIVGRLGEVGLVNDTAFAQTRAKRMASGGRSRRAISAHLAQKGVDAATIRETVPHDASTELAAAIAFARKRRIGPFARETEVAESRDEKRAAERKALGTMARAGFDLGVCERVLHMDRDDADERLRDRREF